MENESMLSALAQKTNISLHETSYLDKESVDHQEKIFSSICCRLSTSIQQQRTIREQELFDFNRIVIRIIHNNITSLLKITDELSGRISDYWHFEINNDTDSNRKYSYVRLYQMVSLLQDFFREQERENKAFAELQENKYNIDLIFLIQSHPGITRRKIYDLVHMPSEELQTQIDLFKKNGLLVSRRSGEDQYYMLTNDGETLYNQLYVQKKRGELSREQAGDLVSIIRFLLIIGAESIPIISILELVQNHNKVDQLQKIKQSIFRFLYKKKSESIFEPWSKEYILYQSAKTVSQLRRKCPSLKENSLYSLLSESEEDYL